MKDASQQQTSPKNSRVPGRLVPTPHTRGTGNAAFGAAATGLGLLAGAVIAITGCHTTAAPAPKKPTASEPVAQSAQPSAPSAPPTPSPAPVPAPVVQSDSQKEASAAPKSSTPPHKTSAAKPAAQPAETDYEPVQPATPKQLYLNKYAVDSTPAKRAPYVPAASPDATAKPAHAASATGATVKTAHGVVIETTSAPYNGTTALQLATDAAAAGPFVLCIEGDVTVANYDAATGSIETFERQTYVLSSAPSADGAIPWEDFPFNIHYRCDGAGNCTLFHSGASAAAKLVR